MTQETGAIETRELTKQFGTEIAVDGLDLAVDPGTVYGFLGPNGAGKTTTMRMLTSLTRPTDGEAWINGNPVSDRDEIRASIGYLPEEPPVFDELTGREQLEYYGRLRDIPATEMETRIADWLDRFGLTDDADKRIDDYSKGMRQKIGLIQALLHEPDVVFLDEPTSGLDPRAARTVIDVIADLTDDGHTVFLSTHILSVVEELADVVGVLYEGDLVTEGAPAELTARMEAEEGTTLEDVFLSVTAERGPAASESAPGNAGDATARQDGRVEDDRRIEDR
ncbi:MULTISPECIES: ABC transporter ATP-binding protein [unclassified Halorubrum]|uniref:ABC transporter ATP-binding protein n=1 Tax=unclassified Halorubrum TaxID=2642239 RepID=UPI000B998AA5|nr:MULTISPECIES: ABC transporter ATP-binding protein [unclassified Halorubrum]OYR45966.1 multidrug ABC transporter ATP-binding protein [Halorubrum sp. Hd13]OYR54171.1 multidrug ABC transporter ATP-binding protein [Halorubrum sp. Ea1]